MHTLLLLIALAASPATFGPADVAYTDLDRTAVAPQRMDMESPRTLEWLEAAIIALPEDPWPVMQYGFAEAVAGNAEGARTAYEDALTMVQTPELERHVRWSYGWALSLLEDYDGAIAQWQQSAALHGGNPYWLPYSMALVHWRAGREGLALQWYQAAVDGFPQRWGNMRGVRAYTRNWRHVQQQAIGDVYAAWKATQ